MSKKTLYIILIFLILGGGIAFLFYYLYGRTPTGGVATTQNNDNLFPFDNSGTGAGNGNGQTNINTGNFDTSNSPVPRLRKLSENPLAGQTGFERDKKVFFRFIERATGHISESPADKMITDKITNTTIPKIYEALWTKDGSGSLLRYLKDDEETIVSFYASIGKASTGTPASLTGTFLTQNIESAVVSPDRKTIAFVLPSLFGATLYMADSVTLKPKSVFSSALREWNVAWPEKNTIVLTSKASNNVEGFVYAVSLPSGSAKKILGGLKGLTANLSADGKQLLYSNNKRNNLSLKILDIKTNREISLPFNTLPEKCVWSQKTVTLVYCAVPKESLSANLPDEWYKGGISFDDDLWAFDSATGSTLHPLDPATYKQSFDITNLSLDPTEQYILFTNKKDLTGWVYQLIPN